MPESFTANQLRDWLKSASARLGAQPVRLIVAYSGGCDSSVLLHAISDIQPGCPVQALHVDHGLQSTSAAWARHCQRQARSWGISCEVLGVKVDSETGQSLEEAAREARYAALREQLKPGDWLVLAQHADDQAETFLLQLMRGASTRGLSAMPEWRELSGAYEMRPFLRTSRAALAAYAKTNQLDVIDDPHNKDLRFDRVFVREQVMPVLAQRWPRARQRLGASSEQMAVDADLVATQARHDLAVASDVSGRVSLTKLSTLPRERQNAVLREWLAAVGEIMPPRRRLRSFLDALESDRQDHKAELVLGSYVLRHFNGRLYRVPAMNGQLLDLPAPMRLTEGFALGPGAGCLVMRPASAHGTVFVPDKGLEIRWRKGGERLQLNAGKGRRALKDLLREAGVVPWMRSRIPLLFAGDKLVAVGDLWQAFDAENTPNARLEWLDRPALF